MSGGGNRAGPHSDDRGVWLPATVFVSYSRKDKKYYDLLKPHLDGFVNMGKIKVFAHDAVKTGARWQEETESAIAEAVAAILLVTENYLASKSIMGNQFPRLLEQAKQRGAVILPLLVKPSIYEEAPGLYQFKPVNDPENTFIGMSAVDKGNVLVKIARAAVQAASGVRPDEDTNL